MLFEKGKDDSPVLFRLLFIGIMSAVWQNGQFSIG
jgi:hypothetical protein